MVSSSSSPDFLTADVVGVGGWPSSKREHAPMDNGQELEVKVAMSPGGKGNRLVLAFSGIMLADVPLAKADHMVKP